MTRDQAEIELAQLLLERRRLARFNLAPSPRVVERIRILELFLYGIARMSRLTAQEWLADTVRLVMKSAPVRFAIKVHKPGMGKPSDTEPLDELDRDTLHAAILSATGNKGHGLYTPRNLQAMSDGAVRAIAQRLGVLNQPVPSPSTPEGADRSAPEAPKAPAPEPRAADYGAIDEWARSHADRHADEMAARFGWNRDRAHRVLHHAILSTAMRSFETGQPVRGAGTFDGKRVKVNVKRLPPFRASRRVLVRFASGELDPDRTRFSPRPAGSVPAETPSGVSQSTPQPTAKPVTRPGVRTSIAPLFGPTDEHPIAQDLRLFKQHVRSQYGNRGPQTNTPAEHALLSDFVRKRGLKVQKSPYTYYDDDTHTLYHPTPDDHAAVGAAYVRQGVAGGKFERSRRSLLQFAKKPAPVYPEIVRHAAAAMDAPHDDLAAQSFADHLAEAHPGQMADDFLQWVTGKATHHILGPHAAPSKIKMYHVYGPHDRTGITDPQILADATDFEMRQRMDDPVRLPWYGRRWDQSGWTLRKPAPWAHPFQTIPRPGRRLLPTVEVARQLYENVGPGALVAAILALRHYRPENKENHERPNGSGINFSRRYLVRRYAGRPIYKPAPLTNPEQLFPEENADVAGLKNASVRELNTNIRQGLSDKEGTIPTVSELTSLAQLGEPVRGSHADQRDVMTELLRKPEDADRWATINAILSANSLFTAHTKDSLRGFANWVSEGRPTDPKGLDRVFGTTQKVTEQTPTGNKTKTVMTDWGMWPQKGTEDATMSVWGDKVEKIKRFLSEVRQSEYKGGVHWGDISQGSYKTPNFGLSFVDPRGTALDTHMARLLTPGRPFHRTALYQLAKGTGSARVVEGIKNARDKLITRGPVYFAYKTLLGHAAKQLGWSPREVQETVWTALMSIMAAKGHNPDLVTDEPRAEDIVATLDRKSIAKGWDLTGLLTDPGVIRSLELVGVNAKEVSNVAKRARARRTKLAGTGPASVERGAYAPLEAVARRLEPADSRTAAAQPILDALKKRGYARDETSTQEGDQPPALNKYALVNRHDFLGGLRRMASSNHADFVKRVQSVAERMGMMHTKALPALHDTPTGAVPGVAGAIYGESPPDRVSALAAWVNGLLPNGPGYAVFHLRPGGPDTLYRLRHDGSGMDVRSKLDRAGIKSRIMIPHRRGFDVVVPDQGNRLSRAVEGYAQQHGLSLEASSGYFKTAGSATDQADSRAGFRDDVVRGEQTRMARKRDTDPRAREQEFRAFLESTRKRERLPNPNDALPGFSTITGPPDATAHGAFADWIRDITGNPSDPRAYVVQNHQDRLGHVREHAPEGHGWYAVGEYGDRPPAVYATKHRTRNGLRVQAQQLINLTDHRGFQATKDKATHALVEWTVPKPPARGADGKAIDRAHRSDFHTFTARVDANGLHDLIDQLPETHRQAWRDYATRLGLYDTREKPAPQQFARPKGHIWFKLIGAARKALRDVPTGPDYQRLFWHEGNKHAHWVSADGDEEKHVRHIKRAIGKVRGVKKVTADAESWPKGEGWKEIPVKRGSKVAANS